MSAENRYDELYIFIPVMKQIIRIVQKALEIIFSRKILKKVMLIIFITNSMS